MGKRKKGAPAKKRQDEQAVSLSPLEPDEALKDLMKVKPGKDEKRPRQQRAKPKD